MKIVFVAFVIGAYCAIVLSQEITEEIIASAKTCLAENKLTEEQIMKVFHAKARGEDVVVDENIKCTLKCIMVKNDAMDEASGTFKPDVVKKLAGNDPMANEAIDNCKDIKGETPCETAYLIAECIIKQN